MENSLKIEEFFMFILAIFIFYFFLAFPWWVFLGLFLLPDIGIIGYLIGPKFGSLVYNFLHHKGIAIAMFIVGALIPNDILQLIGIIIFAHSSLDRMFGFGLKYRDNFGHTHLGEI